VHYLGARRDRPFIPINCGAIPDSLVEAELFGHERGAFTDARQARPGVVAQADGGTLFLDEIDALSPKAQVTLLRFLQDQRYRPLGHRRELACDLRVIAASNRPLAQLVEQGQFRGDLLYRLNILWLPIPPLRERPGDAELLAQHFLRVLCAKYALGPKRFHADTLRWIAAYHWPGNVRELENLVHRQILLVEGDEILYCGEDGAAGSSAPARDAEDFNRAKARAVAQFERSYLSRVLAQANGNVTLAARLAGKERRAFGKLLKKHGIERRRFHD
jgi:DNA-binding NtrC family response regulator